VRAQANLVGVKDPAYSSLAAFLAHYRALKAGASRNADENQLLAEMSAVIATLAPENRSALDSTEDDSGARRHRDRAELELRRALAVRGMVLG
jgi:hypothetical protein